MTGLFIVSHIFPYGVVDIQDPKTKAKFKVNGQRLKQFLELPSPKDMECLIFCEPVNEVR